MARNFKVKKGEREKLKLSMAIMGASGGGKTVASLFIAKGMLEEKYPELDNKSDEFWSKIGVIDTEHRRALIYVDRSDIGNTYIGRFQHLDFEPPYDVDSYVLAKDMLKELGCEIIIADSISHGWDSDGGLLDVHAKMGGQFATWKKVNPIINKFLGALTADSDVHVISTIRSKMKYQASSSETGSMKVECIGVQPIMRAQFEYEMLSAIHMTKSTNAVTIIKDNTGIFNDNVRVTVEDGHNMYKFLELGIDVLAMKKEESIRLIGEIEELLKQPMDKIRFEMFMRKVRSGCSQKFGHEDWKRLPLDSLERMKVNLTKEVKNEG